jgi:transcriptional regulator with XRE-family HTH domain
VKEQVEPRSRQRKVKAHQDFLSEAMFTESFGDALRAAIKIEFGTQEAFAEAPFVDKSRISQLISGREIPTPQTLDRILRTFSDLDLQDRVHAAWIRSCAPLPGAEDLRDYGEEIILQIRKLIDHGNPLRALEIAYARRQFESPRNPLWLRLSEEIIEAHMKLREYGTALRRLDEVKARATELQDMGGLVTVAWMRSTTFRAMDLPKQTQANAALGEAMQLMGAWRPQSEGDQTLYQNRKTALLRDTGLGALYEAGNGPMDPELYKLASDSIEKSMGVMESTPIELAGRQLQMRVELAAGHIFKAEELLEELASDPRVTSNLEKAIQQQVRAEIALARGEREEAIDLLEDISRTMLKRMNLHWQGRMQRTLAMAVLKKKIMPSPVGKGI